jgi:hypothetical protein
LGFHGVFGNDLLAYCILDSDYHSDDEIDERHKEASDNGVHLHIWKNKEIENYLLVPEALSRLIVNKMPRRAAIPKADEIADKMKELADGFSQEVIEALADEYQRRNRSLGAAKVFRMAREHIAQTRSDHGSLIPIVSGKKLISMLSDWSKKEFGVSFSSLSIARELRKNEIPDEVCAVIQSMENDEPFQQR